MRPLVLEFEDASGSVHVMRFDWISSHRNLGLSTKFEVEQMF